MKRYMMTAIGLVLAGTMFAVLAPEQHADAHCQVPCGIYNDHARIQLMLEDVTTITKAMNQINELVNKGDPQSVNQASRWIATKEHHASDIITVVSEYFLTQKLKEVDKDAPGRAKYLEALAVHHHVLRAAMKTKQTVEPAHADALRAAVQALGERYHEAQPKPAASPRSGS